MSKLLPTLESLVSSDTALLSPFTSIVSELLPIFNCAFCVCVVLTARYSFGTTTVSKPSLTKVTWYPGPGGRSWNVYAPTEFVLAS